jgi:multiple sugar transport system substrate-binding protein
MTKRILIALLIVALALPVFTVVAPTSAQEDITLRWRTRPDNQAEIDVYQAASDEIDAAWDGVGLQYEPGGSETASYQDVLITELTAGTAPDVFWIPGTDVARFAKLGLIMNLAEMAATDETYSQDAFYPQQMDQLTYSLDGEPALWGLPRDASAFVIFYNADLFDEAGLDYPNEVENWDWDAFKTAAMDIDALGDEIKGFGMNAWWANYGYFINAAGSSFFNEDYTACGLNNDATVEALTFLQEIYTSGAAVAWGEDSEPPFLAGNVGMFFNGRWATPGVTTNAQFNWNVAELPVGPGGPSNWLFWGAYVVNANTEHPQEAWELVAKLTSADVQSTIAALGTNIPSRAYSDQSAVDAFLATFDGAINNEAWINGLSYSVAEAPLWNGDWPQIDQAIFNGVTQVLNGEMTPEDFAATICEEADLYFEAQ